MKIQLRLITEIGEYLGSPFDVTEDQYEVIKLKSSKYYDDGGFEMIDENGDWIIISPDIVKKSILKIETIKNV